MANPKQVKLLKKGVEAWNGWQKDNSTQNIDLSGAHLRGANLSRANLFRANLFRADLSEAHLSGAHLGEAHLSGAHLSEAHLWEANLSGADLWGANLGRADFSGAHLIRAFLGGANLSGANLSEADLSGANLWEADLSGANLRDADLRGADLSGANLIRANLNKADLSRANLSWAKIGFTTLGNIDLSEMLGLVDIQHDSSSTLGTDTMLLSKGKIPEAFLRGCGLSDWEIEAARLYDPNLTNQDTIEILYKVVEIRASQPIQISPLFISYSHADSKFVDKLEISLNDKGVRFWRDVHHATAGPLEKQIDQAISQNRTVLLILSENSIKSDWVQHEVRKAREVEKATERYVLCPVALDDSWKTSLWPKRVVEQVMEYNILDFSKWNDNSKFKNTFIKLIDGLNLYYKEQS
jgi:uncharacterized protein YjbI with pentapeptide repeats